MKIWESASIEALNIEATAQGGANSNQPDGNWKDQYNNMWTSYASGNTHEHYDGTIDQTETGNEGGNF